MAHTHLFEIGYKAGISDPVGKGLKHDIAHLGLGKVAHVASAQLYKITGKLSEADSARITKDLLCDPILNEPAGKPDPKAKAVTVDVWYKAGVTEVRTGMRYHLQGVMRKEAAEKIALALLVNPLVHEMTIHAN